VRRADAGRRHAGPDREARVSDPEPRRELAAPREAIDRLDARCCGGGLCERGGAMRRPIGALKARGRSGVAPEREAQVLAARRENPAALRRGT